jgi:2-polyprenyl-3-methyl-5-hydroxy-6-metoxy-1,4-benzoquinol methylase
MRRAVELSAGPEIKAAPACPLCSGAKTRSVWRRSRAQINRCSVCGVLFVVERPTELQTARLYDEGVLLGETPESHPGSRESVPEWKSKEQFYLLDRAERLGIRGGRLLDVGCFVGTFLNHARQRGFEVSGVEPFGNAYRYVSQVLGMQIVHGTLRSASYPAAYFSVVSLLDVIEHVPDPIDELREALRILRPGGAVVISTPNAAGLLQQVLKVKRGMFRQDWCPIDDVPWHLWGFTRSSLRLCVERSGFTVREIFSLVPSPRSSNEDAGSSKLKKGVLGVVSDISLAIGMSDRMALIAQKPVT